MLFKHTPKKPRFFASFFFGGIFTILMVAPMTRTAFENTLYKNKALLT